MNWRIFSGSSLLLMLLSMGCSRGGDIQVSFDRQADFSRLETFRWKEGELFGVAGRTIGEQTLQQVILSAAERDLAAKGMRRADQDPVDVNIEYSIKLEFEQEKVPLDTGVRGYSGPDAYSDAPPLPELSPSPEVPETYAQVTVGFTLRDPRSNQSLWQGSGKARLRHAATPDQRRQRMEQLVQSILNKYPPRR